MFKCVGVSECVCARLIAKERKKDLMCFCCSSESLCASGFRGGGGNLLTLFLQLVVVVRMSGTS